MAHHTFTVVDSTRHLQFQNQNILAADYSQALYLSFSQSLRDRADAIITLAPPLQHLPQQTF